MDVNGWASWIAYHRWQDKFEGIENQQMQELLAIRMAWELALWRYQKQTNIAAFKQTQYFWKHQLSSLPTLLNTQRFIAALHNTTTDEIRTFDIDKLDSQVQQRLDNAGQAARRERADSLGLKDLDDKRLLKAIRQRGKDWSQVRPEWGLANNAAFIVAPRKRTKHINLKERSFLHDYQWQNDRDFLALELIMMAPMLVTHWINMQYNASVTDNLKYGSGNKVLHNVVGGHIGVFEGNGGDLRIGLAMQSLHNGDHWMHEPLRLSVYIAAPQDAINPGCAGISSCS